MKLTPNSRLWSVLSWYVARSKSFRLLSPDVRKLYKRLLEKLKQDHGQLLWDTHWSCPGGEVDYIVDAYAYNGHPHDGENIFKIIKVAFKSAVSEGQLERNPIADISFPNLTKEGYPVDDIVTFVDAAFTKFKWRNAGLSILFVYCVPMPLSRVLKLKWSDLDPLLLDITMSGRKYEIGEPLFSLLQEQKSDWDFQQYVIPKEANTPYSLKEMVGLIFSIAEDTNSPVPQVTNIFKEGLDEWNLRCLSLSEG